MTYASQSDDRFEFVNPLEGDWYEDSYYVRQSKSDDTKDFSTDKWDVEHRLVFTRKAKPVEVGSRWKYLGASGNLILEIVGLIENNGQTYVATRDEDNKDNLFLDEVSSFRKDHKEITG